MDRQPKLTPRAKEAQIAPNDSIAIVSVHDISLQTPSDQIVPFEPTATVTATEDVSSQVQLLVRTAGREAFKENFYLYMRTLIPVGIASVWMFAIYAVLSYLVPNVFCKQTSMELSVSKNTALVLFYFRKKNASLSNIFQFISPLSGFSIGYFILCLCY
jgi:hypothetical protein